MSETKKTTDLIIKEELNSTIILTDNNGKNTEFEFLDFIKYENKEYAVLLPVDENAKETVSPLILEVVAGEYSYLSVKDDEILLAVYDKFKERFDDILNYNHKRYDYLLILGGRVIGAETPSDHLLERIHKAAEYLEENPNCVVIPCGGCFREGQTKSEALIIKEHLINLGIVSNRYILEDKSTTTFENFENAYRIIETDSKMDPNKSRVAFLSSDYHINRASKIAELCGFENIGKIASVNKKGRLKNHIREFFVSFELIKKGKKK